MAIILMMIVAVEVLFINLKKLLTEELVNLTIGHDFNRKNLLKMSDLLNAIDYIENGNPTDSEIIQIIQHYEEI